MTNKLDPTSDPLHGVPKEDWAVKRARQAIDSQVPGSTDLVEAIAIALKQEREIALLESTKIKIVEDLLEECEDHLRGLSHETDSHTWVDYLKTKKKILENTLMRELDKEINKMKGIT